MRDLPRPGLDPMSPALAGGFLTTAPPGKPCQFIFDRNTKIIDAPTNGARTLDIHIQNFTQNDSKT